MESDTTEYILDRQVGFLLRRATQRHLAIFATQIPDLTPTQFAALAKLCEAGPESQNALGRQTAMDAATIKGVIDRLRAKGLVTAGRDPGDQRRITLAASSQGRALYEARVAQAQAVTRDTLAPLTESERDCFLALLAKLT
ncbi:MarR family transcriptional regulator [Defluviimonas sp. 20V17]|uniref:Transcriptional regulator n=1 Tax=Allgaiera indica TaxID=765699 RepID=A0AAN4UPB4_9RHOB|nr:MarR family transcriptional regulator [Allgaiera indica]KDB04200.1 MarR family transcriptional regulator [Defluviimonas sp. 20V17]GHD99461.1 transcriptional regulator [Allgaiera indica]SDW25250.1 DNA-binding transcriptional regulator, MarR family [Allgaiera indica]